MDDKLDFSLLRGMFPDVAPSRNSRGTHLASIALSQGAVLDKKGRNWELFDGDGRTIVEPNLDGIEAEMRALWPEAFPPEQEVTK